MRHQSALCSICESPAALRRRDVCRVRARVTAAHVLQCFADAVGTLHSGSRSCNHRSLSVRCLWHRQARRSENRACEARGSVDIKSTCRDDEDLSAPFASGVMPTSASYVIMAIIRHTRRVHGNSECTVRQVHGATHCHEGHAASHRLGFGLIHRVLACWCSVVRCSPRYGRHLHGSGLITTHMEHDNMCEPTALKTTRKSTKRA